MKRKRKFRRSLTGTLVVGMLLIIFVMEVGAAAIGYLVFSDIIQTQYKENAEMIAKTVASVIDPATLDGYLKTGEKDVDFLANEALLQSIAENEDCAVIYVAKINEETQKRIYIYDVVSKESGFTPYEIGYESELKEEFLASYRTFYGPEKDYDSYVYGKSEALGNYVTTVVPMKDASGRILGISSVVKTMRSLSSGRRTFLEQLLIWAFFIAMIVGNAGIFLLRRRMVVPLQRIIEETDRFARDSFCTGKKLSQEIKSGSEIKELAEAVESMEASIIANVNQVLAITAEKNRVGAELNIATKIQANVLPKICEAFPGREEIDVYAIMDPAKAVGGDFYDCFFIDRDHFAMVIADVSGKGVPAALFMMVSKVLLKTVTMGNSDPGEILAQVNQKLCENNDSSMFVTVWLGILDLNTGLIQAASAGHEYPVLCRRGGRFEILKDKHGFVLGGMEAARYKTYTISMQPGDRIFLYTDGLPEANNEQGEQFGMERMLQALNQKDCETQGELVDQVLASCAEFVKDAEPFDDTTILTLRYNGARSKKQDGREESQRDTV